MLSLTALVRSHVCVGIASRRVSLPRLIQQTLSGYIHMAAYSVEERGSAYSTDYRMYISELHVHVIRVACLAVGVLILYLILQSVVTSTYHHFMTFLLLWMMG